METNSSPRASVQSLVNALSEQSALVIGDSEAWLPLSSAPAIWAPGSPPPLSAHDVLIRTAPDTAHEIESDLERLETPRTVIITDRLSKDLELREVPASHTVILAPGIDPLRIAVVLDRLASSPELLASRRLSAMQRSLTQALSSEDPVSELLGRLGRICNATVSLMDRHGVPLHSSGPVPASILRDELIRTDADSQRIDKEGWHGLAARVRDDMNAEGHGGWIIAIARHKELDDPYIVAAVHFVATLVETSRRMAVTMRNQDRAIRGAVLEECLDLRRNPTHPELTSRLSTLGLRFEEEIRVVVIQPWRARNTSPSNDPSILIDSFSHFMDAREVIHLSTARGPQIISLMQINTRHIRALTGENESPFRNAHIGIGRPVKNVSGIHDSYQDALLAVRTLKQSKVAKNCVAFEDFDYATRLFADVGFDKMITWATEFLRPLKGNELILEGLKSYFDHDQNISAACSALKIHQNSLRYRLAKAESLLDFSLKEPAAISSVFLALTALDLNQNQRRDRVIAGESNHVTSSTSTVDAPDNLAAKRSPRQQRGVVR